MFRAIRWCKIPFSLDSASRRLSTRRPSILVLPGDGVGPELVAAAQRVIEASGASIDWKTDLRFGWDYSRRSGQWLHEHVLSDYEQYKVLLKGPITVPTGPSDMKVEVEGRQYSSPNQALRQQFELFANVRPAQSCPAVLGISPVSDLDLVVVRENNEDVYGGKEEWINDETVQGTKVCTRSGSRRIARLAMSLAAKDGRTLVTVAHKANVCRLTDGLFLDQIWQEAQNHPSLVVKDHLADSLMTNLVLHPRWFEVIVCPNMIGDLLSDLAAGLIGSLGLCPSAQYGHEYSLFEPCHGSAPDIAGQGLVNPLSQIRSGIMLLEHLGQVRPATILREAIDQLFQDASLDRLENGNTRLLTRDIGGVGSTEDVVQALLKRILQIMQA